LHRLCQRNTKCVCLFTVVSNCFDAIKFTEWTCFDAIVIGRELPNLDGHHLVSNLLAVGYPMPFFQLVGEDDIDHSNIQLRGFHGVVKKPFTQEKIQGIIKVIQEAKEKIFNECNNQSCNSSVDSSRKRKLENSSYHNESVGNSMISSPTTSAIFQSDDKVPKFNKDCEMTPSKRRGTCIEDDNIIGMASLFDFELFDFDAHLQLDLNHDWSMKIPYETHVTV
jgi:hypothetical protein